MFICIGLWSCESDKSETQVNDLLHLNVSGFELTKKVINDTIFINIVDSTDYLNEVLLAQKIELSLQNFLSEIRKAKYINTRLNLPNRDESSLGLEVDYFQFYKNIVERSKVKKYNYFLQKFIERLNRQNDFHELIGLSTGLQIVLSKTGQKENWFGINTLDFVFKKFVERQSNNEKYEEILSRFELLLKTANKLHKEKNEEMFKFFKIELLK